MPLYRYVKAPPGNCSLPSSLAISLPTFNLPRFIPYTLIAIGLFLVTGIATPIIYHELVVFPQLKKITILSPLPTSVNDAREMTRVAGVSTFQTPANPSAPSQSVDYSKASNWFPALPATQPSPSKITHYTLDIPRLNIKNAVVTIAGDDLHESLVQYGGTASPGEFGSPVIFGHSILRQFYNPAITNSNRYMSIFSTIMTLKNGDDIIVNFDGIKYTYKVTDKYEVKPDEVNILQQRFDRQSLKMITCVPEGTYLRRGIIESQLVQTN